MDIRSSNFNLQKSNESASDACVPYPFCPSTHAGMVSQQNLLPVTGMGQGSNKSGHDSYPKRFSMPCTFIPNPAHDKTTPLIKNQLSTQ